MAKSLTIIFSLKRFCLKTFRARGVSVVPVEAYFRSTLLRMNDFLAGHDLCPTVLLPRYDIDSLLHPVKNGHSFVRESAAFVSLCYFWMITIVDTWALFTDIVSDINIHWLNYLQNSKYKKKTIKKTFDFF